MPAFLITNCGSLNKYNKSSISVKGTLPLYYLSEFSKKLLLVHVCLSPLCGGQRSEGHSEDSVLSIPLYVSSGVYGLSSHPFLLSWLTSPFIEKKNSYIFKREKDLKHLTTK